MTPVTAAELVADPTRIAEVDAASAPVLLTQLTATAAALAARMPTPNGHSAEPAEDRLLKLEDAAAMLQVSEDFIRRSPAMRPLRVRVDRELRVSAAALQRYIHRRTGRE